MFQNDVASETDLEKALHRCSDAARHGYAIAKENLQETAKAIKSISDSLSGCLASFAQRPLRASGIVTQLTEQLVAVVAELKDLQEKSDLALEERRSSLDCFSIALFGRTMAGKSTLMEILTRGDGTSIGTGSQRTTRDVRSYFWQGLKVTDVPGVAAFEGEKDEKFAFEAATKADLVLFLITDDAPQPAEAECLAQVRRLGKPVLGICNVKAAVDDEDDLRLFLRAPARPFAHPRINQLLNQFQALVDNYLPGRRISFVATHLRSRFLAGQPGFERQRDALLRASRFAGVESRIAEEVIGRGAFLRVKSFVDGAVVPMMDLSDRLLEFSAQNSGSGRVLVDKRRQIQSWEKAFCASGTLRITTLLLTCMDSLRDEVPSFAEDHYEDSSAGKNWKRIVEENGVFLRIENLQKNLVDECKKSLIEVAHELTSELSLVASFSSDRNIKMDSIFDVKRVWNWGTTCLSGGIGIVALAIGSGPIGLAAVVIGVLGGLFSMFFDDREKKVRRAREALSKRLTDNIDNMEKGLQRKLRAWFHQELLGKQVHVLLDDLLACTSGLFELADAQRTLAWTLNDRQKHLARTLVAEALRQINAAGALDLVRDVARVPGHATMLLIKPDVIFPEQIRRDLEKLLGEPVWFVIDTKNAVSILSQAIGRNCIKHSITIEDKIRVAHVSLSAMNAATASRIKLAQQLTGLHIMK